MVRREEICLIKFKIVSSRTVEAQQTFTNHGSSIQSYLKTIEAFRYSEAERESVTVWRDNRRHDLGQLPLVGVLSPIISLPD